MSTFKCNINICKKGCLKNITPKDMMEFDSWIKEEYELNYHDCFDFKYKSKKRNDIKAKVETKLIPLCNNNELDKQRDDRKVSLMYEENFGSIIVQVCEECFRNIYKIPKRYIFIILKILSYNFNYY